MIFKLLSESLRLMAPILAFTSDEAWDHLPSFPGKSSSVHCELFPSPEPAFDTLVDMGKWDEIMALRDRVLKEIETARNNRTIGDSLEARVVLRLDGSLYRLAAANLSLLKLILVVSGIELKQQDQEEIIIEPMTGHKCPRCWNRFPARSEANEDTLCQRCQAVTSAMASAKE